MNLKSLVRRLLRIFAAPVLAVALAVAPIVPAAAQTPTMPATNSCYTYINHEYEVCFAYLVNSSLAVLVPFYKYANSPNMTLDRYVTYRLGSRYYGSAYSTMQSRVASWPAGNYDVATPDIRILSVNSNLATNLATLVTQETWRVHDEYGRSVYQETAQQHVVQMARVPSYILHKWVVTDIR